MLLSSNLGREWYLSKPVLWLFNTTLAIIFLAWMLFDATVLLLKKLVGCIAKSLRHATSGRKENMYAIKLTPVMLTGLLALSLAAFTLPAAAGEDVSHVEARKLQAAGEILSFEKIAEIARSIKPGDILETELERNRKSGMYIYELEILDAKGTVWELDINAKTGELMKIEIDE